MLYFSDNTALKLYRKLSDDYNKIHRELKPYNHTRVSDPHIARRYGQLEGLDQAIELIKLLYAEEK